MPVVKLHTKCNGDPYHETVETLREGRCKADMVWLSARNARDIVACDSCSERLQIWFTVDGVKTNVDRLGGAIMWADTPLN